MNSIHIQSHRNYTVSFQQSDLLTAQLKSIVVLVQDIDTTFGVFEISSAIDLDSNRHFISILPKDLNQAFNSFLSFPQKSIRFFTIELILITHSRRMTIKLIPFLASFNILIDTICDIFRSMFIRLDRGTRTLKMWTYFVMVVMRLGGRGGIVV